MKRTLYPKLLGGYLIYGLICFIIISTFGYHITFNFLERRDASTLYRESALISSNYAENYFKRSTTLEEMKTQLSTLSTYLSSEIWIIDKQGQILLNTASYEILQSNICPHGFCPVIHYGFCICAYLCGCPGF